MKNKSKSGEEELKKPSAQPIKKKNALSEPEEENKLNIYLRRVFGGDENSYEDRLSFIGKWVILGLLLLVEILLLLQHAEILIKTKNWVKFTVLFAAALALTVAEVVKNL